MFVLVYVALAITVGLTVMLAEFCLGRASRKNAVGAFRVLAKNPFWQIVGWIGLLVGGFIILSYYGIIAGWTIKYMVGSFTGLMDAAAAGKSGDVLNAFLADSRNMIMYQVIAMLACIVIVAGGVGKGIERACKILMPALFILLLVLIVRAVTLPGAREGIVFYLKPDFSKLSGKSILDALSQGFFSLSLGMGIMITYGSYLDKKSNLTSSVAQIGGFDLGVSFLAGLMIVPAAFVAMGSGDAVAAKAGPSLMFITLPSVFNNMGNVATIIGFLFFLLVLFAALTSAISLVETCVSIIQDGAGFSRMKSFVIVMAVVIVAGIFINLGYNHLSFVQPLGEGSSILDSFDFISNSVLMPIVALLTCVFVGWIIKPETLIEEVKVSSAFKLEKAWVIMIKYVAPVLVTVILIAYVGAQFGIFKF